MVITHIFYNITKISEPATLDGDLFDLDQYLQQGVTWRMGLMASAGFDALQ
jgi:hypothetical protein